MDFDKTNKVIIETMTQIEAKAFILFLQSEIARHEMDITNARILKYDVCKKFHISDLIDD